jgi:hypothetical protein
MTRNRIIVVLAVLVLLVPVMFEVEFNPRFALPRTVVQPDAAREVRYRQCVSEQTDQATREALQTADNPDVQSLMIRMRQNEAATECRTRFPEQQVEVEEPLSINLVDLRWRFHEGRESGTPTEVN